MEIAHPLRTERITNGNLLTEVRELKAELAAIRDGIEKRHSRCPHLQYNPLEQGRVPPRGYWRCERQGRGARCKHCFNCGGVSHLRYQCLKPSRGAPTEGKGAHDRWQGTGNVIPITSNSKLVGRKCIVSCLVQGKKVNALWDIGAQVCVALKCWKEVYLPNEPVRDIIELLREDDLRRMASGEWHKD